MKMLRPIFLLLTMSGLAIPAAPAYGQAPPSSFSVMGEPAGVTAPPSSTAVLPGPDLKYVRPTEKTKIRNYAYDAFGPYPIVGAALFAGIDQYNNAPPEWNQGVAGYSRRFGSDFAIAAVTTTTRYALAEALREDALYYRCECKGTLPRLRHSVISTFTARRGDDGHTVLSFSALASPYAGTMVAVYGWYPGRYGAEDAFRLGNYSVLAYITRNVALEFVHSGPRSWLNHMHLNNGHGAVDPDPKP
jgi:hypothetical protein